MRLFGEDDGRLTRVSHPRLARAVDMVCDAIDNVLAHLKSGKPLQREDLDALNAANDGLRKLFPHERPRKEILREFLDTFL